MSISQIAAVVPAPLSPVGVQLHIGWSEIERRAGLIYPSDFRDFVSTYGTGTFGVDSLEVFNPFDESYARHVELALSLKNVPEVPIRHPEWGDVYELFPKSPGLFPWGRDHHGHTYFWLANESDPDEWSVVVIAPRDHLAELFPIPMTSFLALFFSNELEFINPRGRVREEQHVFFPANPTW